MITTRITLDVSGAIKSMTALEQTQIPFAKALAINALGAAFQTAERDRLTQAFTLRRAGFILREGVKRLGPAASKANPTVTFGVSDRADFLRRFEPGTTKFPVAGGQLAVPIQVRRNKQDILTTSNRPRALVERLGRRKGAGGVFVIKQPTTALRNPGIYQRTGRGGRKALKFLFGLEPSVKSDPRLHFVETAKRVANEQWARIFDEAMATALRGAR